MPCGLFSSSISRSVFVLFPFWSFKARGLKRVKKADLKCSREFTSCKNRVKVKWGEKIWKSTMHGTEKLKEGLKRDLQKHFFPWENTLWNVLSSPGLFTELCFKMEAFPWAHVSSEMNWKLTGDGQFYFAPWMFLSPLLNMLDFSSSGIYIILEQWMMDLFGWMMELVLCMFWCFSQYQVTVIYLMFYKAYSIICKSEPRWA